MKLFKMWGSLKKTKEAVKTKEIKEAVLYKEITLDQLKAFAPNADSVDLRYYLPAFNEVLPKYEINNHLRKCHFLAQVAHESGEFRYKKENLNYSKDALLRVFGKYFDEKEAEACARKPQEIANIVYGGRMGNVNTNDGWKYRGRGLIQLTGKNNYKACSDFIGVDLVANPDLVNSDPFVCVEVACWYWVSRSLNELADADNVKTITKYINGGYNGLEHRMKLLERAKRALGV